MKKLIQFSIIFLLLSFSYSCTKNQDEDFSFVEGFVVEYNSKKPIPNACIIIQYCNGGDFLGSFSCSNVDTIYADANGHYSYRKDISADEFRAGGASSFFLVPSKKGYFSQIPEDYVMPTRGAGKKDMMLYPQAWLRVHVKPVNKYGSFDSFELGGLYSGDGGFNFINKIGEYYTPYYKQGGNDSTTIYWTINKEGGTDTKFQKKVYLTSTDSTTFELLF